MGKVSWQGGVEWARLGTLLPSAGPHMTDAPRWVRRVPTVGRAPRRVGHIVARSVIKTSAVELLQVLDGMIRRWYARPVRDAGGAPACSPMNG